MNSHPKSSQDTEVSHHCVSEEVNNIYSTSIRDGHVMLARREQLPTARHDSQSTQMVLR